jgi:hypothetical protein
MVLWNTHDSKTTEAEYDDYLEDGECDSPSNF